MAERRPPRKHRITGWCLFGETYVRGCEVQRVDPSGDQSVLAFNDGAMLTVDGTPFDVVQKLANCEYEALEAPEAPEPAA